MVKRIIIGKRGPDNGLWISKPGANADSTSVDDFLIDTSHPVIRAHMRGSATVANRVGYVTGTISAGITYYDVTVTHGLGFVPIFTSNLSMVATTSTLTARFYVLGNYPAPTLTLTKPLFYIIFGSPL